jgi:hypothetical protein
MGKDKNVYSEMKPLKKKGIVGIKKTQEQALPITPKVVTLVEDEDCLSFKEDEKSKVDLHYINETPLKQTTKEDETPNVLEVSGYTLSEMSDTFSWYCDKHEKCKIEAFCDFCKTPLCINCILSN